MRGALFVLVSPEDAVFLGHAHHAFDAWQTLHILYIQRLGVADQVNFGQGLLAAALDMHAGLDALQRCQMRQQLLVFLRPFAGVGTENQNHFYPLKLFTQQNRRLCRPLRQRVTREATLGKLLPAAGHITHQQIGMCAHFCRCIRLSLRGSHAQ